MKLVLNLFLLFCVSSLIGQSDLNVEYYRHLKYNHVSPYIDISGIHPIDQLTAKATSHYVFKYDESTRLVEIINNHYHTEKKHPLASIGVYRLVVEYSEGKQVRTFFDPNGKRISNDREVYKEIYSYDEFQHKSKLEFYDLNEVPMESNWAIAKYEWEQKDTFVVEKRYDLMNQLVNLSPYFEFGITGIVLGENGRTQAQYNLNDQLEITNNSTGVASYRDRFDANGNHVKYSYYDAQDNLTLNQWQFAVGEKSYDDFGNHVLLEQYDEKGTLTRTRPVYTNATIEISPAASVQDSLDIRKQSLGYLKALQQLDPELMNEVMNDSLNKVTMGYDRKIKKEIVRPTTRNQMMAFAEDWNKSNTKFPPTTNDEITILNIYDRIASVKLISDNWVEYLHLMKLNGKWEIVNLMWQHKDVGRYPK